MSISIYRAQWPKRLIPSGLGLVLFDVSVWTLHRELHQYSFGEILRSLAAIPSDFLGMAIALILMNCLAFTG